MKPYQPSNGTEGDYFMSKFCDHCIHEKFNHTMDDKDKKCPILSASLIYSITEKEYPKEWVYSDATGNPICTAYVKHVWTEEELESHEEPETEIDNPNQIKLF